MEIEGEKEGGRGGRGERGREEEGERRAWKEQKTIAQELKYFHLRQLAVCFKVEHTTPTVSQVERAPPTQRLVPYYHWCISIPCLPQGDVLGMNFIVLKAIHCIVPELDMEDAVAGGVGTMSPEEREERCGYCVTCSAESGRDTMKIPLPSLPLPSRSCLFHCLPDLVYFTVHQIWSTTRSGLFHYSTVRQIWFISLSTRSGLFHCPPDLVYFTVRQIWSISLSTRSGVFHCPPDLVYHQIWSISLFRCLSVSQSSWPISLNKLWCPLYTISTVNS